MVRAYIESNLAFMREHRNYLIAVVEISAIASPPRGYGASGAPTLREPRARSWTCSPAPKPPANFDLDFDPRVIAIAIRAAIDAVPPLLSLDPEFDIDNYATEIANAFELATRIDR